MPNGDTKPSPPIVSADSTEQLGSGTPCSRPQRTLLLASYGLLLGFGFFLLFYHLDGRLLWGDEAENATLARNVVRFGYPKTFDGLNHISLYGAGFDNVGSAWVWSPWLQEYVAAASFSVFGTTTWAARAPFALIGWLCIPLLGWVIHRIYRQHRLTLAAMALLACSEIFVLHARQCRYYSISILAEILFVYAIYQCLTKNRKGPWLLALSLLIEFYSNYMIVAANVPVLLLLVWILDRRDKRAVLYLCLSMTLLACLAVPWIVYARLWHQSNALSLGYLRSNIIFYLSEFHFHFVPLVVGILPVAGWLAKKFGLGSGRLGTAEDTATPHDQPRGIVQPEIATVRTFEWHLLILLPSYALIIALSPDVFMRYLLPLLPAACLLSAVWIFRYLRWRLVAVTAVLVLCLTNALALASAYPWRGGHTLHWPLFDFISSVTVPYHNRLEDVVAYLNREAQPGQTIFVFDPEFPIIFYTPCQIIDARLQDGRLPAQLPDWILSESASGVVGGAPLVLPPQLQPAYDQITISVHASSRMGCVPDPDVYEYHSAAMAPYVLFKRKDKP